MAEMRHPNVMPLYCSFVHKEQLWMVMPYISGGSIFSIMLNQHPNVSLCHHRCTFQPIGAHVCLLAERAHA
jgi:serine/threonine protein kinase